MDYFLDILINIFFYSILIIGLQLLVGYSKVWFLGTTAIVVTSAYTSAIIATTYSITPILIIPFGILASLIVGFLFGLISIRVEGDLFLILSLAFCETLQQMINEFSSLTGGSIGIVNIPPIQIFSIQLIQPSQNVIIVILLLIIVFYLRCNILNGPLKVLIVGSGEDKLLFKSLGLDRSKYLIFVFLVASLFFSFAGWFYPFYKSYLDASLLNSSEALLVFSMMILGGLKTKWGFLLGATIFILIPLLLQYVGLPDSVAFQFRPIIFGIVLIIYMYSKLIWKPQKIKVRY